MKTTDSQDLIIQVGNISIGSNIREIRLSKGIKQVDMVARLQLKGLEISVYSYNRIEKGTQNPTVIFLSLICDILDCDFNDIFRGSSSQ